MEENNKIKIKLTTIIALIVIAIIIIVAIIAILLNKNTDSESSSNVEENKIAQVETENKTVQNENPDTKLDYTDTDFTLKFLKMENEKENMIYSPLSIKYGLQMLKDGANGNTKTQIENVIGNTNLVKYDNIDNILSLANALYIRDTYSQFVKNEYKDNLLSKYNSEIKYDDFNSANNINSWIENKTFGQIKNMLKDEDVKVSEMVLINTLAVDMEWKDSFDANKTYGREFNLDDGSKMTATMMHKETSSDSISYYKDENITTLTMDLQEYEDTQLEFIAIMPNDNLSNYVENFSTRDLEDITSNLTLASKTKYGVDILIPKFSFDYDLNLKEDLKKSGITDAFDEILADFSNMSEKPLYVDNALHKANIDFTEKGIKATAVTVFIMNDIVSVSDPEPTTPVEIIIDKPFMYLIRDKKTNEIWFIGTVYEPNSWENDQADYEYR